MSRDSAGLKIDFPVYVYVPYLFALWMEQGV